MKKLTNTIGSFIVALIIITCPVIVGIGMNSDWLERKGGEGALIHPALAVLWALCVACTVIEFGTLNIMISNSEDI